MRSLAPTSVVVLVALMLLSASGVSAINTKILAQEEECFSEIVTPGGTVSVSFSVTHGGKLDIDASLSVVHLDPKEAELDQANTRDYRSSYEYVQQDRPVPLEISTHKEEITSWHTVSEGTYDYAIPPASEGGKHKYNSKVVLCFNNQMARWTPKWVSFHFYKMDSPEQTDGLTNDEMNFVHALHREAMQVHSAMTTTIKMRKEEERHRDYVESTNSWILWGTIVNASMLIVMSFFQFWYLKRFLSVRHMIRM